MSEMSDRRKKGKRIKNSTMTVDEITEFLNKQPVRKDFQILCFSGTLIVDAAIRTKVVIMRGQLIEVRLGWDNVLLRQSGGWYLKPGEIGVEGGRVKRVSKKIAFSE
jgi:hypothetical protein